MGKVTSTNKKRIYNKKSKKINENISLTLNCTDHELDNNSEKNCADFNFENFHSTGNELEINNIQWINKYDPKCIDDLILTDVTKSKINNMIKTKNLQNIIMVGASGIGKTTTVNNLVKAILGKNYPKGVFELNSYDEKGVKTIHEKLEYFCKRKINTDNVDISKIIVLDEADNMTKKTQQIIGYLMEKYSKVKFVFTCNNLTDIIESIQSRCVIFNYVRIMNDKVQKKLLDIISKENIKYDLDGVDAIIDIANGDLRKAINILQLIYVSFKYISSENVYNICDKPHPKVIGTIINFCIHKNIKEALLVLNKLYDDGYSSLDITLGMFNYLKNSININNKIKIVYINEVCRSYIIINKGLNTKLQLNGCLAQLCLL